MNQPPDKSLKKLHIFDPGLARDVARTIGAARTAFSPEALQKLLQATFRGLDQELSFGYAVCRGGARVLAHGGDAAMRVYLEIVQTSAEHGPTEGKAVAESLVPVVMKGSGGLLQRYQEALAAMTAKGTYPLKNTLQALARIMAEENGTAADEYLQVLTSLYSFDLNYNTSLRLTYTIPESVLAFSPTRRSWQTRALRQVIERHPALAEPFLEGMKGGLETLDASALACFVEKALALWATGQERCSQYLSLASRKGYESFQILQKAAVLAAAAPRLNRYLQARTGKRVSVRPLSNMQGRLPGRTMDALSAVSSDEHIYFAPEIQHFSSRRENMAAYRILAGLEVGCHEFGTFDFDLEKLNAPAANEGPTGPAGETTRTPDLLRFMARFDIPLLAEDLFTIFEHTRIGILTGERYPGLHRAAGDMLRRDAERILGAQGGAIHPLLGLYLHMVLGISFRNMPDIPVIPVSLLRHTAHDAGAGLRKTGTVENSARWVVHTEGRIRSYFQSPGRMHAWLVASLGRWPTPLGRRICPGLCQPLVPDREIKIRKVQRRLAARGVRVYRSDVRTILRQRGDTISGRELVDRLTGLSADPDSDNWFQRPENHLREALIRELDRETMPADMSTSGLGDAGEGPVFWYPEWDAGSGDYLQRHVLVRQRRIDGNEPAFYNESLRRHAGLLKTIRHAFELMKPEGIEILRRWPDGDEFDYRSLLDYAVERKAGLSPSDRIYIKRIKQRRDVAVLLLMDLSRSTSNRVAGTTTTVLTVEKQAVVLFCEALHVLGDQFAVAGYSGTGRLGVDFFPIKDFDEEFQGSVAGRIGALVPQRNTRMGSAIRHASELLHRVAARVRLLILLGDGFPNDIDYKRRYAIEDTRKALAEARSKGIHAHAITVNISSHSSLDDLYGDVNHNVISNVQDLPEKLLRIYRSLTR